MIRALSAILAAALPLTGCYSGSARVPPVPVTAATAAHAPGSCHEIDGRADARCTPGAVNPAVTQATIHSMICVPGWTKTVRPPIAYTNLLKTAQMREYGLTGMPSDYKEDHLEPLEAGGAPQDPGNLFPQPSALAAIKDRDEKRAHDDICSGRKTLIEAQRWILSRWVRS